MTLTPGPRGGTLCFTASALSWMTTAPTLARTPHPRLASHLLSCPPPQDDLSFPSPCPCAAAPRPPGKVL